MATRKELKKLTRQALIASGLELFGEHGLNTPSLDQICENANYTRGAFYVHFRDRDHFILCCMEHVGKPLLDLIFGDDTADFTTIVERFLTVFIEGTYPLGPMGMIEPAQLIEACARSAEISSMYVNLVADAIRRLALKIETAQGQSFLRNDVDPKNIAEILLAIVIGSQTMLELDNKLTDVSATALTMATLLDMTNLKNV
jgi:TetR/AcrR family transcriptional repressor of nem operon